jgi:hypothetical protein
MCGAIPPLPNMPSWHGAQLKHRDNFTFYWEVVSLLASDYFCQRDSLALCSLFTLKFVEWPLYPGY